MIGQFFSSRKGVGASHPSPTTTLDSATEESHTRHLLFPDTTTLYHPEGHPYPLHGASIAPGSGYDGAQGEIDLECPRDIRIIIAQDEFAGMSRTILFDSKPSQFKAESPTQINPRARAFGGGGGAGTTSTAGPTFGGMHARRSSLVTESTTPRSPTVGAFARTRTRGNSISSMPNIDEHTQAQAQAQAQKQKESVDLINICLDCMFGNAPLSYRGNTNKLHIVPLDSRTSDSNPLTSGLQDATNSLGRAEGLRRKSHLAKSYTPSNLPPDLPRSATGSPDITSKESRRRTIFITRTFSVAVPDDEHDSSSVRTSTPQNSLGNSNGFPFPRVNARTGAPRMQAPQARKTPMYGISIILHLPVATSPPARPPSRSGGHAHTKGTSIMSTSAPGHESLGSSLDSDRRAGWAFVDPSFGVESLLSTSLNSDVDDRVDVIGQHWDVITRTLTSLQFIVQERILTHFKVVEASSPPVLQQPRAHSNRAANRDMPIQPPRRMLRLQPLALAFDKDIKKAVRLAGDRVVRGMKIPRVLTGQGKWGVWREEARWLGRWAGRREENFFFFNLLTAFLGNHTEWLNHLGPKWYRKRHREQQKSNAGENLNIPNRTVIVSPDKMAARRLIFLLAAFLPANTYALYDGTSPMRPSTSASLRAYSQSPPTNIAPSRKQSLRRTIGRRPRGKQSLTNLRSQQSTANGSPSTVDSAAERTDSAMPEVSEVSQHSRHSRRSSAHSIRTSLVIPSMSDSAATTKSGTATISTVTPSQNTLPVAHFTLPRSNSSCPPQEHRPVSSESLASANLISTLHRSVTGHASSASTDSGTTSRWGSLMSFWSGGRRESSTDHSDILQATDDGLGFASYRPERPRPTLEHMVQELSMNRELFGEGIDDDLPTGDAAITAENSPETHPIGGSSGVPASAARPIPERPKQYGSELKLSVNEKDGVIEVDIPLPEFGSPLQSPLLGGYPSASSVHGSSFGESSVLSAPYCEPDQPVNVAGWLSEFHPDFAVQAIKPYADLDRDIKRAMSAEPTPIPSAATPTMEHGPLERWVDVCSALIADTHSFSIKRIRLRRLVRLIPTLAPPQSALTPGISGIPGRSQYGNPYAPAAIAPTMTEQHLEEKFFEETIMDFDATLIDAVDRILAQSGQSSRVQSASSSRSSSRRGRRDARVSSDCNNNAEVTQTECKGILFDALETVVKSVTAERNTKDEVKEQVRDSDSRNKDVVKTATDSSLKEGIRRWLAEVE